MIKGLTQAKSPPPREHGKNKGCCTEPSEQLSTQDGGTVDPHNALFMQASLLRITALAMHSETTAQTGKQCAGLAGEAEFAWSAYPERCSLEYTFKVCYLNSPVNRLIGRVVLRKVAGGKCTP